MVVYWSDVQQQIAEIEKLYHGYRRTKFMDKADKNRKAIWIMTLKHIINFATNQFHLSQYT